MPLPSCSVVPNLRCAQSAMASCPSRDTPLPGALPISTGNKYSRELPTTATGFLNVAGLSTHDCLSKPPTPTGVAWVASRVICAACWFTMMVSSLNVCSEYCCGSFPVVLTVIGAGVRVHMLPGCLVDTVQGTVVVWKCKQLVTGEQNDKHRN